MVTDCVINTDEHGRGRFVMRGAPAGTTRLRFASGLRVHGRAGAAEPLVDGRHRADDVTFDLVHREVFAFYELMYSFMAEEVFSLADRCRLDTYAKLTWKMCDPRNHVKTYYMPQTRDLTDPQARLLLKYLRARRAEVTVPTVAPSLTRSSRPITTRDELIHALREGVTVELAVMLQYLYAGYSVPTHGAAEEYVRRGVWTPEQLRLTCGDGGETIDRGHSQQLLNVAREEMIHFLLVNNILIALRRAVPRAPRSTSAPQHTNSRYRWTSPSNHWDLGSVRAVHPDRAAGRPGR